MSATAATTNVRVCVCVYVLSAHLCASRRRLRLLLATVARRLTRIDDVFAVMGPLEPRVCAVAVLDIRYLSAFCISDFLCVSCAHGVQQTRLFCIHTPHTHSRAHVPQNCMYVVCFVWPRPPGCERDGDQLSSARQNVKLALLVCAVTVEIQRLCVESSQRCPFSSIQHSTASQRHLHQAQHTKSTTICTCAPPHLLS